MGHFITSVLGIYIWMFLENPIEFFFDMAKAMLSPLTAENIEAIIEFIANVFVAGFT